MPSTVKEWIELIVPIISLIVTIWVGVRSVRLQSLQIKAAMAAVETSDASRTIRMNWFKSFSSGFILLSFVAAAWLVLEGFVFDGPVTRGTVFKSVVAGVVFALSVVLTFVYAMVAATAPLSRMKK